VSKSGNPVENYPQFYPETGQFRQPRKVRSVLTVAEKCGYNDKDFF